MRFVTYNARNFREIEYMRYLPEEAKKEIDIVSSVIPFKTNNYVVDYLIDWENYAGDPIYILNFPNRNMLTENQYERVKSVLSDNNSKLDINRVINKIRLEMNPHPAQQMTNIPLLDGEELEGSQHKMLQNGRELFDLIDRKNAVICRCGNRRTMGRNYSPVF